jgi:hypothetical protein
MVWIQLCFDVLIIGLLAIVAEAALRYCKLIRSKATITAMGLLCVIGIACLYHLATIGNPWSNSMLNGSSFWLRKMQLWLGAGLFLGFLTTVITHYRRFSLF